MTDINRLQNIVDIATSTKFSINNLFTGTKVKLTPTETLVEPTKEFKGIITDFVVNEFFPSPVESESFIKLVYNTFTDAINIYCKQINVTDTDIFFVYKGGNILRYVAYQAMHELGGSIADKINKSYKDVFKKSDADFSIYINPKVPNYDTVYLHMNNLAYLLQNELRNEFMTNPSKYFRYYKLNDVEKTKILVAYLEKLNNSENVKGKKKYFADKLENGKIISETTFDFDGEFTKLIFEDISTDRNLKPSAQTGGQSKIPFEPKSDYYVDYDPDYDLFINLGPKSPKPTYTTDLNLLHEIKNMGPQFDKIISEQKQIYANKKYPSMMVSSNQTLDFWKEANHTKFSLVRTKVILNGLFVRNNDKLNPILMKLDGELIDVSLSHKDDSNIQHYFDHLKDNLTEYHIKTDSEDFKFKAPSQHYLIEDLEGILFRNSIFPWDDNKYPKRIKRVLFMYFIILLENNTMSHDEKIKYMTDIKNNIIAKVPEMVEGKDTTGVIDTFLKSHTEKDPFWQLLNQLKKIIERNNIIHDLDKGELTAYIKLISDNIDILTNLIPGKMETCGIQALEPARIIEGEVLWGGARNKKPKYKFVKVRD
jgi:hypothetical protein